MNRHRHLKILATLAALAAVAWAGAGLAADVPGHISYQGMLLDAGFKFPDGTVQQTASGSGGGCLWGAGTGSWI